MTGRTKLFPTRTKAMPPVPGHRIKKLHGPRALSRLDVQKCTSMVKQNINAIIACVSSCSNRGASHTRVLVYLAFQAVRLRGSGLRRDRRRAQRADVRVGFGEAASALTPIAPCALDRGRSITRSAMRGAATLDHRDFELAALLPTLSIMSAALRHRSRVISISMRASAILCSIPNVRRSSCRTRRGQKPLRHFSQRDSAAPSVRMQ